MLTKHSPSDIHSQEINPTQLQILPVGWKPRDESSRVVSLPTPTATISDTAILSEANHRQAPSVNSAPPPTKADAVPDLSCFEWLLLDERTLTLIKNELPKLHLTSEQWSESVKGAGRGNRQFWVYYPSSTNQSETLALALQLKRKNFDNYMVRNKGALTGALSLGVFANEKAANALIARVKAAGFDKVQVATHGQQVSALVFKHLDSAQVELLIALQKRFTPAVPIKHISCPWH